jgi:hypothetical protein
MGTLDGAPEIPRKVFISWRESSYHSDDPKKNVGCMDCHMAHKMTGKPVNEWARQVPWGPLRPGGVNHLIPGGNVGGAIELGDKEMVKIQHAFNKQAAKMAVGDVKLQGTQADVTVQVTNEMVGHYFPAMETHNRYAWIEVRLLDKWGKVLAKTSKPKTEEDFESDSPLIFRCTQQPKPECDTLIRPKTTRAYQARLALAEGDQPAKVEAILHFSLDPEPIAYASKALTP